MIASNSSFIFCLIELQKVVVKVEVPDEKAKQKALRAVSGLSGMPSDST